MLFRKKIPRCCSYCANGTKIEDGQILCVKRGCVPEDGSCRRFSYDPCKRVPLKQKPLDLKKYDNSDFSL